MSQINKRISDISGLAILTYKGGDSPLCMGELATDIPFKAFEGVNPKMMKLATVSDKKMDGIIRRQNDKFKRARFTEDGIRTKVFKQPQQFHQSVVTLVKNVDQSTFETKLTPKVVEFVTGKKSVHTPKGVTLPELTTIEVIQCTLAEFALDKFHTLNGMELRVSFYEGGEVTWNSKH